MFFVYFFASSLYHPNQDCHHNSCSYCSRILHCNCPMCRHHHIMDCMVRTENRLFGTQISSSFSFLHRAFTRSAAGEIELRSFGVEWQKLYHANHAICLFFQATYVNESLTCETTINFVLVLQYIDSVGAILSMYSITVYRAPTLFL